MFKVNQGNFRKRYEIYSKVTIKVPFSRVSVVDFEQVNVSWVNILMNTVKRLCIKKSFGILFVNDLPIELSFREINFKANHENPEAAAPLLKIKLSERI